MKKQKWSLVLAVIHRHERTFSVVVGLLAVSVIVGLGYQASRQSSAAGNPLAGASFYIDPTLSPYKQYQSLRTTNVAQAQQIAKIGTYPIAAWAGGWVGDPRAYANNQVSAAVSKGQLVVIVLYNIPSRDCGSYSAGGSASHTAYRSWIDGMTAGVGNRRAVIIVEPDALPGYDCLDAAGRSARLASVKYAVDSFKSRTQATVYIDAGTSAWVSAANMAPRLQEAGIAAADGFSLNVSNFQTTSASISYGTDLSGRVGGKHFVIDTSRNGLGSNGEWCNPSGRALGTPPTTATASALADAYLWIKIAGESDGTCNGGPAAGQWWLDYALGLAQRSTVTPNTGQTIPPAPTPLPTPPPVAPTPVGNGIHNDTIFAYSGTWQIGDNNVAGANKYLANDRYSAAANATYGLTFNGNQARLYATKAAMHGMMAVRIDNGPETLVDTYAPVRADQQLVYTSPIVTRGTHTITVRVVGTKNASSSGMTINADRIDTTDSATAPVPMPPPVTQGNGDANADGRVNGVDYSILSEKDGTSFAAADFNRDGTVGAADLAVLLSRWTW